jgi:hypothetical protein
MRSDLFRTWLVFVGCVCGVATAGEPDGPVAEVNEPWVASEHLAPIWGSMTLGTQFFNPEISGGRPTVGGRSLSFGGLIYVIDANGLIGLSEVAKSAKAFGDSGNQIQVHNPSTLPVRSGRECTVQGPSYKPLAMQWITHLDPFGFTIDMSMKYNAPFPVVLSRLEWSMSALLSDHFEAIDIPFAPTADWIELMPGLAVLVEQAVAEEGKYSCRIKARYDPNKVTYLDDRSDPPCFTGSVDVSYSWPWRAYPEMIVTAVDVLDVEGNSVWTQSTGYRSLMNGNSFHDSSDRRIVTLHPIATCSECGKAAFIRHVIAFKPYNQELQFVLENVPVPTE